MEKVKIHSSQVNSKLKKQETSSTCIAPGDDVYYVKLTHQKEAACNP